MKLNQNLLIGFFCLILPDMHAQTIDRIEPPNWWAGMKHSQLQLMIYGERIHELMPAIQYPGVHIERTVRVENPNYLFIDLKLAPDVRPGTFDITFSRGEQLLLTRPYQLQERQPGSANRQGFDNKDVLYLITPDRFANGDPSNDQVPKLLEAPNRSFAGGRHGGDMAGMEQQLDYIADLGYTALWLNPLLQNNQETYSYHGYSTTDYYQVDERFGSNESYLSLVNKAEEKGLKMIMDMIVNHCGSGHWWMEDLPTKDWVNFPDTFIQTNHQKSVIQDPYVSAIDHQGMVDGWFVKTMPDLNQRNPLVANYLTQNSIWWIEFANLKGIRMDTYPYPDMDYMSEWNRRVNLEYPHFKVVGEEWNGNPAIVSYWQTGKKNPNGYESNLKSLMDFPLQETLRKALIHEETSGTGWIELYRMLALDFLYPNPMDLVVFPDNHDMDRFFAQVNKDYGLFQLGIIYTLTTRGIPQIYYGTEILMDGAGDHGIIRSDFPGGWPGDQVNGFSGKGLTEQQTKAKRFMRQILQWRKSASAIHFGKMVHFLPQDGVYVYFRYDEEQKVMIILNKNEAPYQLQLGRFQEILGDAVVGKSVLTAESYSLDEAIILPAKAPLVLELE